jgi:hypothetical protein
MQVVACVLALAASVLQQYVHAEVTVLSSVQTLYDRSPKLRIKATGILADEHDIEIVLVWHIHIKF